MTTPVETKAEGLAGAFGELVRMLRAHPEMTAGVETTLPALAAIALRAARRGESLTRLIEWGAVPVFRLAMRSTERPRIAARLSSMRRAWRRWDEEPGPTFKTHEAARAAGYWAGVLAERHHTTAARADVDVQRARAEAAEGQLARELAKGKT